MGSPSRAARSLIGKRFTLTEPTLGILIDNYKCLAHRMARGTVVTVTEEPSRIDDEMVTVEAEGQEIAIFTADLRFRGLAQD